VHALETQVGGAGWGERGDDDSVCHKNGFFFFLLLHVLFVVVQEYFVYGYVQYGHET
jgi:hypothetical protein